MKCSRCDGTGKSTYGYNQPCTHCDGKGFTEPLTNDEWRRTCSAEEFAEFLTGVAHAGIYEARNCNTNGMLQTQNTDFWFAWLKEIHHER